VKVDIEIGQLFDGITMEALVHQSINIYLNVLEKDFFY
jgi:hypothetical protein